MAPNITASAILVAFLAAIYGPAVYQTLKVAGILRTPANTVTTASNLVVIEDTTHCEDLHHHVPSNKLFAACEDDPLLRFSWFPPLHTFDGPNLLAKSRGSIHVIDPQTLKSERLKFENFAGPFVTHGIEVISDPKNPKAVYIYAINHLPNPEYLQHLQNTGSDKEKKSEVNKARSQLEVFHHVLGSSSIKHIRSIWHPLIETPNDIYAISTDSILVTNDHYHREGHLRALEDVYRGATWTNIIHIKISDLSPAAGDSEAGIIASVAHSGLHNNNGLGHGRTEDEVIIDSAASGVVHVGKLTGTKESPQIHIVGDVQLDSVADNPAYFADPYATSNNDASGFVIAGVSGGYNLSKSCTDPTGKDPIRTFLVKPGSGKPANWETRVLFDDDGSRIRSASSAVLVGIDPKTEGGEKRAWLFITGFISRNMIAVKVDL